MILYILQKLTWLDNDIDTKWSIIGIFTSQKRAQHAKTIQPYPVFNLRIIEVEADTIIDQDTL